MLSGIFYKQLTNFKTSINQTAADVERLSARLAEKEGQIELLQKAKEQEIKALLFALREKNAEARSQKIECEKRMSVITSTRSELNRTRQLLAASQAEMRTLTESRSWRITSPIRKAKRVALAFLQYFSSQRLHSLPTGNRTDKSAPNHRNQTTPKVVEANAVTASRRRNALDGLGTAEPKVSVIMPTWNRGGVVTSAVRSALNQSWAPTEVIIIDDGSTDDTIAIIKREFHDDLKKGTLKLLCRNHEGISSARNAGLLHATGKYIAYLDSDNIWHADHLLFTLYALVSQQSAKLAYAGVRINNQTENTTRILARRYDRTALLRSNFIDLNSIVHDKELYDKFGGFDESLTRLIDWEYIIKLTSDSEPIFVPIVTVEYFLNKDRLANVTFTENLENNATLIRAKHSREFQRAGITPRRRSCPDHAEATLGPTEKDSKFFIVTGRAARPDERIVDLASQLDFSVTFLKHDSIKKSYRKLGVSASDSEKEILRDELPEGAYWWPDPDQPLPNAEQLRSMFISWISNRTDMTIISYDLTRGPHVSVACLRNQCLVRESLLSDWINGAGELTAAYGKVLRMPPSSSETRQVDLCQILGGHVEFDKDSGFFGLSTTTSSDVHNQTSPMFAELANYSKDRPTVFVFAMKLAVGGVERNTVEIMRALKGEYNFVYITMEKITEQQGSLAPQVLDTAHRLIDMCEIGEHNLYLSTLRELKAIYKPDIVWICNGSMWLSANAHHIRRLFADIPIVDQQVYDTSQGWIRHYHKPSIQSFDRFIAINNRIKETFVERFNMKDSDIELIYPALNSRTFSEFKIAKIEPVALRKKYNLPIDKKVFVFMGRLVEQKQPLHFLELSQRRADHTDEHFLLVGNGVLAPKIKEWFAKHRPDNAQWIRHIEKVEELWAIADGMVITSLYEGLPISMLEAMSMGVPIISTDVGDVQLVLRQHGAGMIVDTFQISKKFEIDFSQWKSNLNTYKEALRTEGDVILERFSAASISRQYMLCWNKAIAERKLTQMAKH